MDIAQPAAHIVLVITAALLFYIAVNDLREFKIRNDLLLVLTALFFVHAALSGRWVTLHWNILFAAAMFAAMLWAYQLKLMGGGDLKLMVVAFLWCGLFCSIIFAVIVTFAALLHTFAALRGWVHAERVNGSLRVAYAPSIAVGLIGTFMSGCLGSEAELAKTFWQSGNPL